jgi:hypothetical protein
MVFKLKNKYIFKIAKLFVFGHTHPPPPPRLGYVMQYNAEITRKACELCILLPYQTNFVAVFKRNSTNPVFKQIPLLRN